MLVKMLFTKIKLIILYIKIIFKGLDFIFKVGYMPHIKEVFLCIFPAE